ncbi:nuclear transport factor 2 family protein [Pedobacter deserti]|uniref:nuclear transport factor 2 family protein n=1 Tax=Pedobacter deserti TaxID=2817382 RepID=UPI00210A7348|nr:nuclear transport factor 2 family protein [Pedobacter sp. SYSU D00382]
MNSTADHKNTLELANAAASRGDYEAFLSYCTDDTKWDFVGEQVLQGKEAVRQYMAETYLEPPQFDVEHMVAEGDMLTAIGKISLKDKQGKTTNYAYCDVWTFRAGKMHELQAFVVSGD